MPKNTLGHHRLNLRSAVCGKTIDNQYATQSGLKLPDSSIHLADLL